VTLFGVAAFSAETRSPSLFAATTVRDALKEQGVAPEMRVVSRTSSDLRRVVSRNLDPQLLTQAQSISGRDFEYQFADPSRMAHLGVIVLKYPAVADAKRMVAVLAPQQNHFRSSKILIRFSTIVLGSLLVVTYSENSGDDRIVEALKNLAASFEKASGGATAPWGESEAAKTSR
jgi:hypothetical protein